MAQGYESKEVPISSNHSFSGSAQMKGYESKVGTGDVYKQRDNYVHVGFAVSDMAQKELIK